MKSTYTRDVKQDLIDALLDETKILAFLNYVKENPDLALCFRGNASEIGRVTIYKNNHMIWDLTISGKTPKVSISADHSRFMYDWNTRVIRELMELGFVGPNGATYEELIKSNTLVSQSYDKKNNRYNYSIANLTYYPNGEYEAIYNVVDASYKLLVEMQDAYFSDKYERPRNYIKEYYFETHKDGNIDSNTVMYASFQRCVEKHAQQDLFINNHVFCDGLFIYDLEFAQPTGRTTEVKKNNKPDMFGVRFDEDGNLVAICMIEVKSTPSALNQNSGLKAHLNGMEEYMTLKTSDGKLMDDRIKEARLILNQYHQLGLYGVDREFSKDEFDGIEQEIIFIFTNEVSLESCVKGTKDEPGKRCSEILSGYIPYNKVKFSDFCAHVDVVKKAYL